MADSRSPSEMGSYNAQPPTPPPLCSRTRIRTDENNKDNSSKEPKQFSLIRLSRDKDRDTSLRRVSKKKNAGAADHGTKVVPGSSGEGKKKGKRLVRPSEDPHSDEDEWAWELPTGDGYKYSHGNHPRAERTERVVEEEEEGSMLSEDMPDIVFGSYFRPKVIGDSDSDSDASNPILISLDSGDFDDRLSEWLNIDDTAAGGGGGGGGGGDEPETPPDIPLFPRGEYVTTECYVCFEEASLRRRLCCEFPVCDICLESYLDVQVSQAIVKVECLNIKCNSYIHRDEISARLPPAMKLKFYKFLIDANVDPSIKTCPRCSNGLQVDKSLLKHKKPKRGLHVTCARCQLEWCFTCHAPLHAGLTCKEYRTGDVLVKDWAKEFHYGQQNAQKCPKCKIFIQRSLGCDHMRCSNCDSSFCYRCGEQYRGFELLGNHFSRLSPFGCRFNFMPDKPHTRRLIRGAVLGGKIIGAIALSGFVVAAGAVAVGIGVVALPVWGGYKLHKRRKYRQRLRASRKFAKTKFNNRQNKPPLPPAEALDFYNSVTTAAAAATTDFYDTTDDPHPHHHHRNQDHVLLGLQLPDSQRVEVLVHRTLNFSSSSEGGGGGGGGAAAGGEEGGGQLYQGRDVVTGSTVILSDVQEVVSSEGGYTTVVANVYARYHKDSGPDSHSHHAEDSSAEDSPDASDADSSSEKCRSVGPPPAFDANSARRRKSTDSDTDSSARCHESPASDADLERCRKSSDADSQRCRKNTASDADYSARCRKSPASHADSESCHKSTTSYADSERYRKSSDSDADSESCHKSPASDAESEIYHKSTASDADSERCHNMGPMSDADSAKYHNQCPDGSDADSVLLGKSVKTGEGIPWDVSDDVVYADGCDDVAPSSTHAKMLCDAVVPTADENSSVECLAEKCVFESTANICCDVPLVSDEKCGTVAERTNAFSSEDNPNSKVVGLRMEISGLQGCTNSQHSSAGSQLAKTPAAELLCTKPTLAREEKEKEVEAAGKEQEAVVSASERERKNDSVKRREGLLSSDRKEQDTETGESRANTVKVSEKKPREKGKETLLMAKREKVAVERNEKKAKRAETEERCEKKAKLGDSSVEGSKKKGKQGGEADSKSERKVKPVAGGEERRDSNERSEKKVKHLDNGERVDKKPWEKEKETSSNHQAQDVDPDQLNKENHNGCFGNIFSKKLTVIHLSGRRGGGGGTGGSDTEVQKQGVGVGVGVACFKSGTWEKSHEKSSKHTPKSSLDIRDLSHFRDKLQSNSGSGGGGSSNPSQSWDSKAVQSHEGSTAPFPNAASQGHVNQSRDRNVTRSCDGSSAGRSRAGSKSSQSRDGRKKLGEEFDKGVLFQDYVVLASPGDFSTGWGEGDSLSLSSSSALSVGEGGVGREEEEEDIGGCLSASDSFRGSNLSCDIVTYL